MNEEIETDKWRIFFKKPINPPLDENYLELIFRLKADPSGIRSIKSEELEELEKDLNDLGKWRKFKELKKDLEE